VFRESKSKENQSANSSQIRAQYLVGMEALLQAGVCSSDISSISILLFVVSLEVKVHNML
jgi:hypothetical protein